MKKSMMVLAAVYASFIALGMPDGAFGVAWPSIRYEMYLGHGQAFFLVLTHSVFFSITCSQMGRLATWFKLPNVNMLGLMFIMLGIGTFALSPNLYFLLISTMVMGVGMGMVDSGLNAFAAKHFSVWHMNWLHCFWGLGGAISPIIMSQMVLLAGWRRGYVSVLAVQAIIGVFVLITLLKGFWVMYSDDKNEEISAVAENKIYLEKKRYPIIQIIIILIYVGFEYAITFWTTSVMFEARGLGIEIAGLYPAVYLGAITGGRFVMGYVSNKFSNISIIRFGVLLSVIGLIILTVSNNIIGMAFIGFGFGPIFPCLMHETSNRFSPDATTKLVGYQVAAAGIGVGASTFGMARLLEGVSLNALFPAVIVAMVLVFLLNEVIEAAMKKKRLKLTL